MASHPAATVAIFDAVLAMTATKGSLEVHYIENVLTSALEHDVPEVSGPCEGAPAQISSFRANGKRLQVVAC